MKNYPVYVGDIVDKNYEHEIINQKYDFIEEVINEVIMNKAKKEASTAEADKWMTHPVWGMPIFFGIMAVVFLLTFLSPFVFWYSQDTTCSSIYPARTQKVIKELSITMTYHAFLLDFPCVAVCLFRDSLLDAPLNIYPRTFPL